MPNGTPAFSGGGIEGKKMPEQESLALDITTPAAPPQGRRFELPADEAPAAPAAPATPAEAVKPQDGQTSAAEAPAKPQGDEKPPTTGQDPEKQSSRRFERRLDKAYRRAAEAQARAELLEKQLAEARKTTGAPPDADAPKLENFKDIEEYAEAKAKYAAEKALKDHTQKQSAEAQKKELDGIVQSWNEKAEIGAEKYDDWDEIVGDVKPTEPWAVAAMEAENAADVMYYLGKNDAKEAKRIMALPPRAQIREIGKIEAKLAAEPPKPKTPSKAPAPITPLTGAAPVASEVPSEEDDYPTWLKKRNKQVHRNRL